MLQQILDELNKPVVVSMIQAAREAAGSDIGAIMEEVVPIFFEAQGHCMEPLGFVPDDEGFALFADQLKSHEGDAEFAVLSKQLKKLMKDSTTPITEDDEEEQEE